MNNLFLFVILTLDLAQYLLIKFLSPTVVDIII